jgi:hypothetical protein
MATLTREQAEMRDRVEGVIRFIAPALDVVLWVGDRVSRFVEPEDYEHHPVRVRGEGVRSPIGEPPPDNRSTVG